MLDPTKDGEMRRLDDLIDRLESDWAVALDYNRNALVGIDKQMMAVYEKMDSIRKEKRGEENGYE